MGRAFDRLDCHARRVRVLSRAPRGQNQGRLCGLSSHTYLYLETIIVRLGRCRGRQERGRDPELICRLGSLQRVGRGVVAEQCRNVTFESMLFSSHLRCSMGRSLLPPAFPLMDLHFFQRDGVAAIQESGTRTSALNKDTKSSECLHTQLPNQTRQVQLSATFPHSGARFSW